LWITGIKDVPTRVRLVRRLRKLQRGLYGDIGSVGSGVFELREFFGPGWRMYYIEREQKVIVMLAGGDKSSQDRDIEAAKALALTIEE
jgi:putative addiction module killer protein